MDKREQIAMEYANCIGYDSVRLAWVKDGFSYFRVFNDANIGHKTGLPYIIKINEMGN